MTVSTALVAGVVLGVRHALEADHLAAVATLVDDDRRASAVGASWGVGHSVPIAALGLLFVLLGVRLPDPVTTLFEAVVGVVLVALGARTLWRVVGRTDANVGTREHAHGGGGLHSHLGIGSLSVGLTHSHLDGDSFVVGVVHGFAGSGALVVALVSTAPTPESAVSFLGTFSLLSVATMAAAAAVWGRTLGTSLETYLKAGSGILSAVVGAVLLAEQVGALGLA
ncbi:MULTISPECIES: hypothetical protein [Halorussus]|uniref:HoxN/HupN/NixA family nickel/cobalt transporter n=1 Tax=Halorussus TaxID=1070314 RepID=UPI0020A22C60|nr:hypothetical protein [Halorussus vallis]USZ77981.1 hypothetical protein NGM07_22670 [Halorussus vallis]USZ78013.1 hypothetical protein NGM07_20335 [Halorussus vallis]